jgi:hypothetical protein
MKLEIRMVIGKHLLQNNLSAKHESPVQKDRRDHQNAYQNLPGAMG